VWPKSLIRAVSSRPTGVDTHDVGAFPGAARRARWLRLTLAGGALALVVSAAVSARELDTRKTGLLPSQGTGVVVVDLSLSIEDENYRVLRRTFSRLIADDASIGLVLFSDLAYELLPPGTPASELRPLLRLLTPPKLGAPVNPWADAFRAGTRISSALELARTMLERDTVEDGSILLVSDLETTADDVPLLTRTIERLRRDSISLHLLPLGLSSDARLIFGQFLKEGDFGAPGQENGVERRLSRGASSQLPIVLMILGVFCFVALAAHEHFGGRLALPRLDAGRQS
jgi:hypothetical protein